MGENKQRRESIFRFKQFSVINKESAMKVGTDGVLLGAWCDITAASNILDIGTGTGLIALMAAQRNHEATITAIEIDPVAANEAHQNFQNSPWSSRLNSINADFNAFTEGETTQFDHIISNPPFYTTDIVSPSDTRATARHTGVSLTFETLLTNAQRLLTPTTGKISIITPSESADQIKRIATNLNLTITRQTQVHPKPNTPAKRILWELTNTPMSTKINTTVSTPMGITSDNPQTPQADSKAMHPEQEEDKTQPTQLTIELDRHIYTQQYINLTKDFYLKM